MKRPDFKEHQRRALDLTKNRRNVAYYMGMGTGKTFVGCEQMLRYGNEYNLCIVQKSKVDDWVEHFRTYTDMEVIDYTKPKAQVRPGIIVVTYGRIWRRPELLKLRDFTLMLDESSKVQNEGTRKKPIQQTMAIMSLRPRNTILLSGTPCNGKYENLYTQVKLLGVDMTKTQYWNRYIDYEMVDVLDWSTGTPVPTGKMYPKVLGYRNIDELKEVLRRNGAVFMLSDDVLDLPPQTEQTVKVKGTPEYRKFRKERVVIIDGKDYVGDTSLTKMLVERQLCSYLNKNKLDALADLMESTEDRLIVFYNFQEEFVKISQLCDKFGKQLSYVNGSGRDLTAYENDSQSVTLVQYQAGAHGLNLQKANKMVMFSPPLSCELWEQAKARIHRLGQERPTMYWYLVTENSVEERIYETLKQGRDYTVALFEGGV